MDTTQDLCLDPEIVTANNARLHAHSRVHYSSVESRMCLWCKEGEGSIVVNGRRWPIRPRDYFALPWRHDIRYEPAGETPLYLAGIHLIPWHDSARTVEWQVAHGPAHPLYGVPWRQDRALPGVETPTRLELPLEHPLLRLSEYIVQHAASSKRDRIRLKHCAHLLIQELADVATQRPDHRSVSQPSRAPVSATP